MLGLTVRAEVRLVAAPIKASSEGRANNRTLMVEPADIDGPIEAGGRGSQDEATASDSRILCR